MMTTGSATLVSVRGLYESDESVIRLSWSRKIGQVGKVYSTG